MPTRSDDSFDQIMEELIREFLRRSPFMGTYLGLHEWDFMVPDASREGVAELISVIESFIERLENDVVEEELSGARVIDYPVVLNTLKASLVELVDWPLWRMYPAGPSMIGEAVFPLIIDPLLPREHVAEAIKARLRPAALQRYVSASIDAADKPYQLWVQYAIMAGQGINSLLDVVKGLGREWGDEELSEVAEGAKEVVAKELGRLQDILGRAEEGYLPTGWDPFVKLLKYRFITETPEELRLESYRDAEMYRERIAEAAKDLSVESVEDAIKAVEEVTPSEASAVLDFVAEMVDTVRSFVYENDVVELPPGERVQVIETPDYLKPVIPFAAYMPPKAFGPSLLGTYLVTPPQGEEGLKKFSYYDVLNTVVHEAYPGHHTQHVYEKAYVHPYRRIFAKAWDMIEGWAHYCEELMLELGIDNSPHYRVQVWKDALWRAVRVYLDIEIHVDGIPYEKAVEKLVKDAYLPEDGARAEVLRYTMSPTYQLSYWYGKRAIKALREEVKKILGQRFSNTLFHKLLLEEGALPVNILRKVVIEKAKKIANQE